MYTLRRSLLSLVLLASLCSLFAASPASAHSATPAHARVRSLHAQAASPHVTGCTPGSYHLAYKTHVLDQGTHAVLGYVALYADGCGWVQAEAFAFPNFGIINHLIIDNANGQAITTAGFSGTCYGLTAPVPTHGEDFSAFAVIQDAHGGYWGADQTSGANGYWYSSSNGPLD